MTARVVSFPPSLGPLTVEQVRYLDAMWYMYLRWPAGVRSRINKVLNCSSKSFTCVTRSIPSVNSVKDTFMVRKKGET